MEVGGLGGERISPETWLVKDLPCISGQLLSLAPPCLRQGSVRQNRLARHVEGSDADPPRAPQQEKTLGSPFACPAAGGGLVRDAAILASGRPAATACKLVEAA
jgi:hypothetical protein